MAVQKWRVPESEVLTKLGIQSRQLVWPRNAPESWTTITQVTMEPGSVSERHAHERSEQIWIVERGEGGSSFYLRMNKLKLFARVILSARHRENSMESRTVERSRLSISPLPLRQTTSLPPTTRQQRAWRRGKTKDHESSGCGLARRHPLDRQTAPGKKSHGTARPQLLSGL